MLKYLFYISLALLLIWFLFDVIYPVLAGRRIGSILWSPERKTEDLKERIAEAKVELRNLDFVDELTALQREISARTSVNPADPTAPSPSVTHADPTPKTKE